MKKSFVIILFVTVGLKVFAQDFNLEVSNPFPRVGEKIYVKYEILHPDSALIIVKEEYRNKPPLLSCKEPNNILVKGNFEYNPFQSKREVALGPISLNLNGKIFTSNSLRIAVAPKLPNVKTGFWVNFQTYNNVPYIIIEQRIDKEIEPTMGFNTGTYDRDFVEIDPKIFNSDDMITLDSWFTRGTSFLEGDSSLTENQYSFKKTIYKIWMNENYNKDFLLTKNYFKNYSNNLNYKPIKINR